MKTGFCVIYRFRVRPGAEDTFRHGWAQLTKAIRDRRGGLGSRLHRTDEGLWLAYAQWPNRDAWERARQLETADPDAARTMGESIEESLPPILLEPEIDLLEPLAGSL